MNNVNNVRFDKLMFLFKRGILFTLIMTAAVRLLHKNVQPIATFKKNIS